MNLLIKRELYEEKQTLGYLYVLDKHNEVQYDCCTLELPWRDNEFRVSCIPKGEYKVTRRVSQKFNEHFHIQDVNSRTYILIHAGNFYTDILGCVLVGDDFTDIDGDGLLDVTNSVKTLGELLEIMPDDFNLTIK